MKKILLTAALFVAFGAASAQWSPRDNDYRRYDERSVYRDNNGSYHWQVVERRVWIPTHRVGGIFGRTIPGHYEIRRDRIKVYHNRYDNRYDSRRSKHPHGMPPGQRKKYEKNNRDDDHWEDRNWNNDRDRRRPDRD